MAAPSNPLKPSPSSDPIYFVSHKSDAPYPIFSQWYPSSFQAPAHNSPSENPPLTFTSCEQYIMYHKALLFGDTASAAKILKTKDPRKIKGLGRGVSGYDEEKWVESRERIVNDGNWHKFTSEVGEAGMREQLLGTGERLIVEAADYDRVWGIGFSAANAEANRDKWGLNLLEKALMNVRKRLREEGAGQGKESGEEEVPSASEEAGPAGKNTLTSDTTRNVRQQKL